MNRIIIISVFVVVAIGLGFFIVNNNSSKKANTNKNSDVVISKSTKKAEGYTGVVLAGNASPFLEFNMSDYDKAISENKVILLDFYANWCPICRAEEPEIFKGFDNLNNDNIVGFRVNFNDSDTDNTEKDLAKEFNIPYQHTKVVIKNGKEIARYTNQWTLEDFNQALGE